MILLPRIELVAIGAAAAVVADVVPAEIYGPFGAIVLLAIGIGVLWRAHAAGDARERAQTDLALAALREQTPAIVKIAEGVDWLRGRLDEALEADQPPPRRRGRA